MTTGVFKYLDPTSLGPSKPWAKVDGPGHSFTLTDHNYPVSDIREQPSEFTTDKSGFSLHHSPAVETAFTNDATVRSDYYAETEALLRAKLPGVKKVVMFDHTIRKHDPSSPRQPVQQVHVDQTPAAAAARVRRHLPHDEVDELLKGRYQIINVWRPIGHAASDFPLALIDWRSTKVEDFIGVDLMYPDREKKTSSTEADSDTSSTSSPSERNSSDDDRGHEVLPSASSYNSTTGYSVKGETFGILPSPNHKFYYVKDMTPQEALFIKCFDSRSEWMGLDAWAKQNDEDPEKGVKGVAHGTPHTAFIDPATPEGVKGRESIEVRALVFYE